MLFSSITILRWKTGWCDILVFRRKLFTVATPTNFHSDRIYTSAAKKAPISTSHLISEPEHSSRTYDISWKLSLYQTRTCRYTWRRL